MSNGTLVPFQATQGSSPIAQLPVPGQEPGVIDAEFRDDTEPPPITDESAIEQVEQASGGLTSLLLLGAVGFGLYLAFRK